MRKPIELRAHHLLCIPRFYRGGYNKEFAKNMKKICAAIRKSPEVKVKILVGKPDYLCKKCPHRHENRCDQSEEIGKWVVSQDRKIAGYLRLKANSVHRAKEVFNLSIEIANRKTIKSVCRGCIFSVSCSKVRINNSFRKDLNKN